MGIVFLFNFYRIYLSKNKYIYAHFMNENTSSQHTQLQKFIIFFFCERKLI